VREGMTRSHQSVYERLIFTVWKLRTHPVLQLVPMNPGYSPITFQDEESLEIFDVVTFIVYAAR
jgi:DNA polymerase V